ncbi:MAG: glycerol-3-phosphate 1-O-acyltransferase PlsY [Alphaproteobacteria bacterium]|nr:glycerol-3-phosphate 1-O-acyltransferase PlsY [Alphaproteobacteria bacterium]
MKNILLSLVSGYLIGSIPTGYLLTKLINSKDIRQVGSGSTGATNVLRSSGNKTLALLTLLIDVLKGFIVSILFINNQYLYLAVVACLIGHVYPIWLKGKGGKGVATAAGVLLGICPYLTLISALIWGIVLKRTHISSVASLSFISSIFILVLLTDSSLNLILLSAGIFGFLCFTHRSNLIRLINHQEKSLNNDKF